MMAELARLQDAYKIQESRVRDAKQRLDQTDARIAALQRELAAVDGEIAKLKGEEVTAGQRIKLTQDSGTGDEQPRTDPARVRPSFERARLDFRQDPTREKLAALHQQCSQLYGAMVGTPATKDRVRGIDCDPKQASETAGVMFALNDGIRTFGAACAGGDKLEANKTTDALYGFSRKCLADSGLPARETDELRTKINYLELSRDDKAHPFVATINAFNDGNRLAYLALGIAVAMDLLVFMSGLFGANAVRSPLSDVPSMKARSGRQLEAIVQNALLPDTFDNARAVLNAMRPMTSRDGFSARVVLHEHDPHASDVRRVLNAAATIGAVRHVDGHDELYEVRSELFEFLSVVAKKAFEANDDNARQAELRKVVEVALRPHVGDHADIVLHQCRPISERNGFSAEIYLGRMPADDAFVVQKVLNAGATLSYVQLDERPDQDQRYYVHKQLYKTLLLISSAAHRTGQRSMAPRLAGPEQPAALEGGSLDAQRPAFAVEEEPLALTRQQVTAPDLAETETEEEIRGEFWVRLVGAVGVDPRVATDRLNVRGLAEAATGAWNALQFHAQSNPRLGSFLSTHLRHQSEFLAAGYNEISGSIRGSRRKIDILDGVQNLVQSHLPALMVFPEHGLIDIIIASLERAAQADDGLLPGEQTLVNRLRSLKQEMVQLDLSKADDWEQLRQWYEQAFALDKPNILRLAERRPRV